MQTCLTCFHFTLQEVTYAQMVCFLSGGHRAATEGHVVLTRVLTSGEILTNPALPHILWDAWRGSSMVEQGTHKPLVVGSNPSLATEKRASPRPASNAPTAKSGGVCALTTQTHPKVGLGKEASRPRRAIRPRLPRPFPFRRLLPMAQSGGREAASTPAGGLYSSPRPGASRGCWCQRRRC